MVQLVKCWLCKHEDLGSNPQSPCKATVAHVSALSTPSGRWEAQELSQSLKLMGYVVWYMQQPTRNPSQTAAFEAVLWQTHTSHATHQVELKDRNNGYKKMTLHLLSWLVLSWRFVLLFVWVDLCWEQVAAKVTRECPIPGTRVLDGCELLCGCWDLTLGPLEEQLRHFSSSCSW